MHAAATAVIRMDEMRRAGSWGGSNPNAASSSPWYGLYGGCRVLSRPSTW